MKSTLKIFLVMVMGLITQTTLAAGGDGHAIGLGIITTSPGQDDLDAYTTESTTGMSKLGAAYEFYGQYSYRFSSSIFALQFRPSYFMQSTSGGGNKIDLSGFTFFPMLRFYPLENNFIKFFMQVGIGYGAISGEVKQTTGASLNFSGGAFGALGGLGAEFCFTDSHCMIVEGNIRYLPIQRNIASNVTGTPTGFSQAGNDQELEYGGQDLKTTMSGIQGGLGYTLYF